MCGQHNVRASAGDNTGQNTTKDTPNPRTEIKIPDSTGNRTRAAAQWGQMPVFLAETPKTKQQQLKLIIQGVNCWIVPTYDTALGGARRHLCSPPDHRLYAPDQYELVYRDDYTRGCY